MAILLRIVLACSMLIPAIPQEQSAGKKKGPVRTEELLALIAKTDPVVVYSTYSEGVGKIFLRFIPPERHFCVREAISIANPDSEFICASMTRRRSCFGPRGVRCREHDEEER
jgi:hypothetical protein